ncbi:MAG TPA: polymorphic toxin type 24 domain-containing protein [Thermoanaerobaculia bacterium]|nr:polymorphic toxin type 24 domain-containing protein [Thermoanaerobaculia bacterium]
MPASSRGHTFHSGVLRDYASGTRFQSNAKTVTRYQVWNKVGGPVKRVDLTGAEHGGIATPHVVEFKKNVYLASVRREKKSSGDTNSAASAASDAASSSSSSSPASASYGGGSSAASAASSSAGSSEERVNYQQRKSVRPAYDWEIPHGVVNPMAASSRGFGGTRAAASVPRTKRGEDLARGFQYLGELAKEHKKEPKKRQPVIEDEKRRSSSSSSSSDATASASGSTSAASAMSLTGSSGGSGGGAGATEDKQASGGAASSSSSSGAAATDRQPKER